MRRSLILDTTVRLVFDTALVLSVYLLFAGHNQPGGGFVGGLVAAAAMALRYIAGGSDDVRRLLRVRPWTLASLGLGLTVATAIVPLIFADAPLDQNAYEADLVVLGKVKATTAAVFDAGVYLIVVGLVTMLLEALGDAGDDPHPTSEEQSSDAEEASP